jgi:hypothetical protein
VKHFAEFLLLLFVFCLGTSRSTGQSQPSLPQPSPVPSFTTIPVAAGTSIELILTRPVWAISAKAGDQTYAQTSFPIVTGNGVAIPAGTYVQGTIESVKRPTRRTSRAEIDVLFTKLIFADGYVVSLPGDAGPTVIGSAANPAQSHDGESLIAIAIQVTTANDLLLDNGAVMEMTLGAPLALDAKQVARAIPLSRAPQPGLMQSATQCRFIPGGPGTPGTPDTVIPGSPGTPDTVIPGGPGMPDIDIPGTPATPDTVIPGTPGTPGFSGTYCPPKPIVLSCTLVQRSKPESTSQPEAAK